MSDHTFPLPLVYFLLQPLIYPTYLKQKCPTSVYTEVGHFVEGDACLRLLQILIEEREESALPEKGILWLENPVILIGIDE